MTGRILIVDDEPDIRELLEITLGRMSLITGSVSDLATANELRNFRQDLYYRINVIELAVSCPACSSEKKIFQSSFCKF